MDSGGDGTGWVHRCVGERARWFLRTRSDGTATQWRQHVRHTPASPGLVGGPYLQSPSCDRTIINNPFISLPCRRSIDDDGSVILAGGRLPPLRGGPNCDTIGRRRDRVNVHIVRQPYLWPIGCYRLGPPSYGIILVTDLGRERKIVILRGSLFVPHIASYSHPFYYLLDDRRTR